MTAASASATHSWGGYHWARQANPFTVKLGDNLTTAEWDSHLQQTSSDWTKSTVLDTTTVAGGASGRKHCGATSGRDEICNASYGNNGWLGVAQIWLSGGHIVQGTVKVNDYYLGQGATYAYNNTYEREHVMCQEIGHTFGLDHQDTSGASFGTCMDYYHSTNSTSTSPNAGDYDELLCIYDPASAGKTLSSGSGSTAHSCRGTGHLDSTTTVGAVANGAAADAIPSWANPSESVYEEHLPNGQTLLTYVRWAYPFHSLFY
jgi:hypothetical protein